MSYTDKKIKKIEYIVIHNSATPSKLPLQGSLNSFERTHKERLGGNPSWYKNFQYPNIQYHILIDSRGVEVQTRPLTQMCYHAGIKRTDKIPMNLYSIGICLIMNGDKEYASDKQYLKLIATTKELIKIYPHVRIKGHREVYDLNGYKRGKTCPGNLFDMDKFRKDIEKTEGKYEKIMKQEVDKPIFNSHKGSKPLSEAETKYLIEIALARFKQ